MRNFQMSPKLYVDEKMHGSFIYHRGNPESDGIFGDLLDIYDPPRNRFDTIRRQLRMWGFDASDVKLHPPRRRGGPSLPNYEIGILGGAGKEMKIFTELLQVPGRAAGWAALQLYRERAHGLMIPKLRLIDPLAERKDQVETFMRQRMEEATPPREPFEPLPGQFADIHRGLLFVHDPEDRGTLVVLKNDKGEHDEGVALPTLLQTVKDAYDDLYPGQSNITSTAVANTVGAGDLNEFHQAWSEAQAAETPVLAARALLESDVFLRDLG
jgi:hypothetical protein